MLADNEAVTIAVKIAMIMIPTKIHTMQNIRAKNDLGARSPYLIRKHWKILSVSKLKAQTSVTVKTSNQVVIRGV